MRTKQKTILLVLVLLSFISACKKDSASQAQGQITFTINGINRSYTVYNSSGDTITNIDTGGAQTKSLQFGGINSNNTFGISLIQILPSPGSVSFNTGNYPDFEYDTTCRHAMSANSPPCHNFYIAYFDPTLTTLTGSWTDSSGVLTITSSTTSPNLLSGTFQCQVTDNNGHFYQITNGMFTNIPYTNNVW